MSLSEIEKALYMELVEQMTLRMAEIKFEPRFKADDLARKDRFDIKGRVVEHGFVGYLETACRVLRDIGVLYPLKRDLSPHKDAGEWAAYFRLNYDIPELREHLNRRFRPTTPSLFTTITAFFSRKSQTSLPSLSDVTGAFLGVMGEFGSEISVQREAFVVQPRLGRAFKLLVKCGYAQTVGDKVRWTDRIEPLMRTIYAWNDGGETYEDLYHAEVDEMWRTMPQRFHNAFFSGGPVDVLSLAAVISRFWYDDKWNDVDRDAGGANITLRGSAVDQARELEKRFRDSET